MEKIGIIGAGINGLVTGVELLKLGFSVKIYANEIIVNTASIGAPAVWIQYKTAQTPLTAQWMQQALEACHVLEKEALAGVDLLPYEEFYTEKLEKPAWLGFANNFYETIPKSDIPSSYQSGFKSSIYRLDTSLLLPFFYHQFIALGGKVEQRFVTNFLDLAEPIVINCAGANAGELAKDTSAYPIRGQYIHIEKINNLNTMKLCFLKDGERYLTIVPRKNDCWLGGTANPKDWNGKIDTETTQFIIDGVSEFVPAVKNAKILRIGVTFRSGREKIRVEKEIISDKKTIVHNYGQGGSGITLSFGCAKEVARLIQNA